MTKDFSQVIQDIVTLRTNGPVAAIEEYRNSIIQYSEIVINEGQIDELILKHTPDMRVYVETELVPFARMIEFYFSMFAFCPFYMAKRKHEILGWVRVPVVYNPRELEIQWVELGSKHKRLDYRVFDKRSRKYVQHLLKSSLHNGPDYMTGEFHSECGMVLRQCQYYETLVDLQFTIAKELAIVKPYIQKKLPAATQGNDSEDITFEELARSGGLDSILNEDNTLDVTRVGQHVSIVQNRGTNVVPLSWELSTTQPRPMQIQNVDQEYRKTIGQITSTWKMPIYTLDVERTSSVWSGQNKQAIDQDRAQILAGSTETAKCVAVAMSQVWEIIYNEQNVPAYIPLRTLLDTDSLAAAYTAGVISPEEFVNTNRSLLGFGKAHPDLINELVLQRDLNRANEIAQNKANIAAAAAAAASVPSSGGSKKKKAKKKKTKKANVKKTAAKTTEGAPSAKKQKSEDL